MPVQLTSKSFRSLVAASGLMTEQQLEQQEQEFPDETQSAEAWCQLLIRRNDLTDWQGQKLLQAKHRGFLLGPYQLRRKLARGGMSTIYVARQRDTAEDCVLKILPLARVSEASYLPRFQREARIAQGLDHPNVIQVYGLHCESDGKSDIHFMAMEYLQGENLSEKVKREGPLSVHAAAEYIRQAADGLHYAHQAGLVHRDVKPANFVLTTEGVIKVLDLGLASINCPDEEDLTRQYDERVLGTADYLSPEQAVDSHKADARADVYSLGCTLYFLLTGRPPFPDGLLAQRILAHQTQTPPNVTELRPDVPADFCQILDDMLIKNRDARIQSAALVSQRLQDWLQQTHDDSRLDHAPDPLPTITTGQESTGSSPTQSPGDTALLRAEDSPSASGTDSALSGIYTPEFESFLRTLDEESGVHTVVDPQLRDQQLRDLAVIRPRGNK